MRRRRRSKAEERFFIDGEKVKNTLAKYNVTATYVSEQMNLPHDDLSKGIRKGWLFKSSMDAYCKLFDIDYDEWLVNTQERTLESKEDEQESIEDETVEAPNFMTLVAENAALKVQVNILNTALESMIRLLETLGKVSNGDGKITG